MSSERTEEVLREVFGESERAFDEQLLLQVYAIERQYQFDRDRAVTLEHIRRAVEAFIARTDARASAAQ